MELSTNTTNITIICKTNKYEPRDQLPDDFRSCSNI